MAKFFCSMIIPYILIIKHYVMTKKTTSQSKKTNQTKTTYRSVGRNIYFDGFSYRVRMSIDGVRYSKNFSSKKSAVQFRNELQRQSQQA